MKAKTLQAHGPIPANTTVDVVFQDSGRSTISYGGMDFIVINDILETDQPMPVTPPAPAPRPLVERYVPEPEIEDLARVGYDRYCEKVGGLAFNGDKLPPASEFFEDPAKRLQANAWRYATEEILGKAIELGYFDIPGDEKMGLETLLEESQKVEWSVTPDSISETNPDGSRWVVSTTRPSGGQSLVIVTEPELQQLGTAKLNGIPANEILQAIASKKAEAGQDKFPQEDFDVEAHAQMVRDRDPDSGVDAPPKED